ncbi:hypothetical protein [Streptomyces tricolor]|uniref:hypothetical protein n=1 Tax=Streptomyces tricolor TaxID=68277 RepID=UPI0036EB8282
MRSEDDTRMDKVFKALADDTRRRLLDRLHENQHVRTDGCGVAGRPGRGERAADPAGDDLGRAWPGGTGGNSRVTFEIRSHADIVRLTVVHEDLADEGERADGASGRPAVLSDRESLLLSNLMSLLETGRTLPQEPWLVPSR